RHDDAPGPPGPGASSRASAALAAEHLLGSGGLGAPLAGDLAVLGVIRDVLAAVRVLLVQCLAELALHVVLDVLAGAGRILRRVLAHDRLLGVLRSACHLVAPDTNR